MHKKPRMMDNLSGFFNMRCHVNARRENNTSTLQDIFYNAGVCDVFGARLFFRSFNKAFPPFLLKYFSKSVLDIFFVSSYCLSRIFLTISTALIFSIGCYLPRRMNRYLMITEFKIYGIKFYNLFKTDNMSKIPTCNNIHAMNGCKRNMQHIITEFLC